MSKLFILFENIFFLSLKALVLSKRSRRLEKYVLPCTRSQLSRSHLARILFLNSEKTKPSLIDIGQTATVLLLAVTEDNKTIVQFVHALLEKDCLLRIGFSNIHRTLIWAKDRYVQPRSPCTKCGILRPCEQREGTITLSKAD